MDVELIQICQNKEIPGSRHRNKQTFPVAFRAQSAREVKYREQRSFQSSYWGPRKSNIRHTTYKILEHLSQSPAFLA